MAWAASARASTWPTSLHDGATGQAGAAHRLRPQERHHFAAVRRQGLPTIIETSARKKLAGEEVKIGDVCFKRDGVFAMELGGPKWAAAAAVAASYHGFELLEKLGFHEWGFDFVLLDFLGRRGLRRLRPADRPRHVPEGHHRRLKRPAVALTWRTMSASAVTYFRKLGGNVGVAGIVVNKDDNTGEGACLRGEGWHSGPRLHTANEDIRRKSANYEIIGKPGGDWGPLFEALALKRGGGTAAASDTAGSGWPAGLFSGDASDAALCWNGQSRGHVRRYIVERPSLEVIYDTV